MLRRAILTLALATTAFAASAQMKIAHVNSTEIIAAHPRSAAIQAELNKYIQGLESAYADLAREYQQRIAELDTTLESMSEPMQEIVLQEVQEKQARLQNAQKESQQKVLAKEQALYQPLIDEIQAAIEAVAAAGGYGYVFDSSGGNPIVAPDAHDLLPAVKQKLNI